MMTAFVVLYLFCLFNANSAEFMNNFQIDKTFSTIKSTNTTASSNDALNLNPSNCGKGPSGLKNVGVTKANPGDWSWQVLVLYKDKFRCSGSLINSQWVLTAAHCVYNNKNASFYSFRLGVNDRLKPESWSALRTVSEVHIHHSYSQQYDSYNPKYPNDIALLKLSTPIEYSNYINPICIPDDSSSFAGKNAWTTGWGIGPTSQFLMQTSVPFLNDTKCLSIDPHINPKIQVCAGEQGKTACQIDGGGPLVVQKSDDRWFLGGITSFGGCGSTAVNVRVSYYYNWILSTIRDETVGTSNSTIFSLAELKNGYLAGGSLGSTIKIWNPVNGSLVRTLVGENELVTSLAVLKNGNLASASFLTITIWNTDDGSLIRTLTGHYDHICSLVVLQNGFLASGSVVDVRIWNTEDGSLIRVLTGTLNDISSLAVLKNGHLAVGSWEKEIQIWNTDTGSLVNTLTRNSNGISSLVVLKNGNLAGGGMDSTIKIWNTDSGKLTRTLKGHSDQITSLVVLQNGDLASGSKDSTIRIWNTDTGSLITTLRGHADYVFSLAVLQNGYLASCSKDDSVIIWN